MSNDYVECPINPERYHSESMDTLFSYMNSEDIREQKGKYIFDLDFVRKIYSFSSKLYKQLITEFGLRGIKVHTQKNSKIFMHVSKPPYHMIWWLTNMHKYFTIFLSMHLYTTQPKLSNQLLIKLRRKTINFSYEV